MPTIIEIARAYILRGEAYSALQEHFTEGGFKNYIDGQKCMDRIKAIPAADVVERPRWIPVTERLPEEKRDGFSDDVLMLVENPDGDITWKDVYVGYYLYDATSAETGWWAMMTCDCVKIGEHKHGSKVFPANEYVTHWLPLPEPPEEET